MNQNQLEGAIEAILFTMGKAVSVSVVAAALEVEPAKVEKCVHDMMRKYKDDNRGIMIIELEDKIQLCTKKEYYPQLIKVASQPKKHVLSEVVLETLSIVAYKQPVTRAEIEKIRGVKSDHAVNRLIEYGLIEEAGRLDAPGRPILFTTTEEFLRTFGLSSLSNLPVMDAEQMEEMKAEAEEEIEVGV